jgi:hypothetical protein
MVKLLFLAIFFGVSFWPLFGDLPNLLPLLKPLIELAGLLNKADFLALRDFLLASTLGIGIFNLPLLDFSYGLFNMSKLISCEGLFTSILGLPLFSWVSLVPRLLPLLELELFLNLLFLLFFPSTT